MENKRLPKRVMFGEVLVLGTVSVEGGHKGVDGACPLDVTSELSVLRPTSGWLQLKMRMNRGERARGLHYYSMN